MYIIESASTQTYCKNEKMPLSFLQKLHKSLFQTCEDQKLYTQKTCVNASIEYKMNSKEALIVASEVYV